MRPPERHGVEIVDMWTGRRATALRNAMRMTNETFAEALGTSVRTVAKWSTDPELVPYTELQRALDTMLSKASEDAKARFALLVAPTPVPSISPAPAPAASADGKVAANAELRLHHDPEVNEVLDWLEERAGWPHGEARSRVTQHLRQLDIQSIKDRGRRRGRIPQSNIAEALCDFYA